MIKKIIATIFCLAVILTAATVNAGPGIGGAAGELDATGQPLQSRAGIPADFGSTVNTVVSAILAIVGAIFLIMMVYAGVLWMTAAGKNEQAEKAQRIITESVIGLVITLSAYAITNFVSTKLGSGGSANSGGTGKICSQLGGTCKATADCVSPDRQNVADDCARDKQICCVSIFQGIGK